MTKSQTDIPQSPADLAFEVVKPFIFEMDEDEVRELLIEALAALPQSTERGWKLVPVEPSDAMIEVGYEALREGQEWGRMQCVPDIYTAMIQASPEPPVGMGGGDNFSVARVDVTPPSGASDGQRKSEGGAS